VVLGPGPLLDAYVQAWDEYGYDEVLADEILVMLLPSFEFQPSLALQHYRYIINVLDPFVDNPGYTAPRATVLFQDAHVKYQRLAVEYDMPRDLPGYEVTFTKPDKTQCRLVLIPVLGRVNNGFPYILLMDDANLQPERIDEVNERYHGAFREYYVEDTELFAIQNEIMSNHFGPIE
jgi:hypothetical protein